MKRSMGLDIGTRTIGVATSDLLGMIAGGVETIRRTTEERDFERIGELIKEHEVDTVVLGYPKNMNGTIGERAHVSEAFAEEHDGGCGYFAELFGQPALNKRQRGDFNVAEKA